MTKTDWSNLYKVRIANSNPAMLKHEVVKLILVMKLLYAHRRNKDTIRVYTEFEVEEGLKPDVYFENLRTKEVYAFEIQKQFTEKWLIEREAKYKDWSVPFFKTADFIPIDLKDFTDDIKQINEELEKYIV